MPKHSTYSQQTLTDGATINWDLSLAQNAVVTLGGNRTLANPTNQVAGGVYTLLVKQDATGGRTVVFAGYYIVNGTLPISTVANAATLITFYSDGTIMYGVVQENDGDAQAFINAAAISDATQKQALYSLVSNLKFYGIWTKMTAIYPFVGGSASSHRWNLKNINAFTINFIGGITHSSTGVLPNGTNGYADTSIISNISANDVHLSYYSRTNNAVANDFDIGRGGVVGENALALVLRRSGTNLVAFDVGSNAAAKRISSTTTNSRGLTVGSCRSTTDRELYFNGVSIASNTDSFTAVNSIYPLLLFAYNELGTAKFFGSKECAFCSVGSGLTTGEVANLYAVIQQFQTTLGRNV